VMWFAYHSPTPVRVSHTHTHMLIEFSAAELSGMGRFIAKV